MTAPFFTEYGNQNQFRRYPFLDDSSLKDADGKELPTGFIVDASLYPLDVEGPVYLKTVDSARGVLEFADADGHVFGAAQWATGDTFADVFETEGYGRCIGIVSLGPDADSVYADKRVRVFMPNAATLCPIAAYPVHQGGVRGFLLPDGSLVTGDVVFEGENGVRVTSYVTDTGVNTLRFDIIGEAPPDTDNCATAEIGPPITTIAIEQALGSAIVVSEYDVGVLALTYPGKSLTELCAATRNIYRPNNTDPCAPDADPQPEPEPAPAAEFSFDVADLDSGNFTIAAPGAADYINPISVQPLPTASDMAALTLPAGTNTDAAATAVRRFWRNRGQSGGIVIRVHGLRYRSDPN